MTYRRSHSTAWSSMSVFDSSSLEQLTFSESLSVIKLSEEMDTSSRSSLELWTHGLSANVLLQYTYHCSREKFEILETVVKLSEQLSLSVIDMTSSSAIDPINKYFTAEWTVATTDSSGVQSSSKMS